MSSYYAYKNYPLSVNDLNLLQQRHFSFLSQCGFPIATFTIQLKRVSYNFFLEIIGLLVSLLLDLGIKHFVVLRIFPYSVQMRGNKEHKNSKYRHFSRGDVEQTTLTAINRVKVFEKIIGRIYFCVLGQ